MIDAQTVDDMIGQAAHLPPEAEWAAAITAEILTTEQRGLGGMVDHSGLVYFTPAALQDLRTTVV